MKLSTAHTVDSNVGNTSTFKIAANAKAFMALSSTLYSNKVRSILRELGCNAQDSHKEAGVQRPIEVKLPNALNPSFYVKDYGVGLDEKGILELYTTYFSSSKDQSNDLVGAFGLGSKSPFAYSDSFTVEAVKDGVHSMYAIFIGPNGEPQVAKVSEEPANPEWPSGLMVSFPVAANDFKAFEDEALDVFQWFDPLPKLLGTVNNLQSAKEEIPAERLYPSGAILKNSTRKGSPLTVVMGGVAYPVDHTKIGKIPFKLDWSEKIILFADIGEVEVSISRESLSMTSTTIRGIQGILQNLSQEILDGLESTGSFLQDYLKANRSSELAVSIAASRSQVDILRLTGIWPNNMDLSRWDSSAKVVESLTVAQHGDGFCIKGSDSQRFFKTNQAVIALVSEDELPEITAGNSDSVKKFWSKFSKKLRSFVIEKDLSIQTHIKVISVKGQPDPEKFGEFGCLVVVPKEIVGKAAVKPVNSVVTVKKLESVAVLKLGNNSDTRSCYPHYASVDDSNRGFYLRVRHKGMLRDLRYNGTRVFSGDFFKRFCDESGIDSPEIMAFPETRKDAETLERMGFRDLGKFFPENGTPNGVLDIGMVFGNHWSGIGVFALYAALNEREKFREILESSRLGTEILIELNKCGLSRDELVHQNKMAELAVLVDSLRGDKEPAQSRFNRIIYQLHAAMRSRVSFPIVWQSVQANQVKEEHVYQALKILAILDPA